MDLALLVFTRDSGPAASTLVDEVAPYVDRTLLVDSSSPQAYSELTRRSWPGRVDFLRAPPLGFTEIFRPAAFQRLSGHRILTLDTDERATPELLRALRGLPEERVYRIVRHEVELEAYQEHVRFHRASDVRFRGTIHEAPECASPPETVPWPARIEHAAQYESYVRGRRGDAYLPLESFHRPLTSAQLAREWGPRWNLTRRGELDARPAPLVAILGLAGRLPFSRFDARNGGRGNFLTGRALARYLWGRYRHFRRLGPAERRRIVDLGVTVHAAGGPAAYLGFDDPTYVERLAASFAWDSGGWPVFDALVRFRARVGRPARSFEEIDGGRS